MSVRYPEVIFLPIVDIKEDKKIWWPYRIAMIARNSRYLLPNNLGNKKKQLLSAHWILDVKLSTHEDEEGIDIYQWKKYSNLDTVSDSSLNRDGLPSLNLGWKDKEPVPGEATLVYVACEPYEDDSFAGFEKRPTCFDTITTWS